MSIKNKLQIYLITYNRINKLKYTLAEILKSPIKDFDIIVLDNASTDGTSELIDNYCIKHPNIKHIRHKVNIGGNANICRAFEMGANCGKEYFWILCDDDKYDFSNWNEVEKRMEANEDVICVADYVFSEETDKINPAYQIFQLTFVPSGIYKSKLITDDVLINMYDAILTMFQQAVVAIKCVNENKKICVLSKPIVFNGVQFEDKVTAESLSYTRGANENWVMERRQRTLWILGFANIITLLKDKQLQKRCMAVAIPYKDIHGSWENFFNSMKNQYLNPTDINYLLEVCKVLPLEEQKKITSAFSVGIGSFSTVEPMHLWEHILSVRNEGRHKVLHILGMKIKFRRKKK